LVLCCSFEGLGLGWVFLFVFFTDQIFLLVFKAITMVNSYTQPNGVLQVFMNASNCSILL